MGKDRSSEWPVISCALNYGAWFTQSSTLDVKKKGSKADSFINQYLLNDYYM